MKVVLDTNVLVLGLLSPFGVCAEVLGFVFGKADICYNASILTEYREVLMGSKFGFNERRVEEIVFFIEDCGMFIPEIFLNCGKQIKDPFDRKFYVCAIDGKAEFFITGNKKYFPKRKWIVSPKEFLENVSL